MIDLRKGNLKTTLYLTPTRKTKIKIFKQEKDCPKHKKRKKIAQYQLHPQQQDTPENTTKCID